MGRRREHPPRALGPRCTSAHFFLGCAHKASSSSFVHVCPPTRAAPRAVLGDEMSPAPATVPCHGLCVYLPMKREAPRTAGYADPPRGGASGFTPQGLRVLDPKRPARGTVQRGPRTRGCPRFTLRAEDTAVPAPGGGPGTCISGRYPR